MTLDDYIKKYNGKYIEYSDPSNRFQCVDNMRQYVQDVLGLPQSALPGALYAKSVFTNYNGSAFKKIFNRPDNWPNDGDIVFWGYYPFVTGWAGHVGINVGNGANLNNFISFDQNYPTGSACHRQVHNYKGVLGWLRKI
jgi:hypothetical protein